MKSTDLPALVGTPFGENGIKTPISQNTSPGTNAASYNDGFPAITMTELNNGGLPPRGSDFNQILYELAKSVQWAGTGALYKFSADFATKIGGYPKGSKVIGSDGDVYECQIDDNMNNPVGGAGWVNKGEDKNTRELWRRSLAEIGLTLVSGSFQKGATVSSATDAVWDIDGAQCYTWTGDFPHDDEGEPGAGWVSVGGLSLRGDLSSKDGNIYPYNSTAVVSDFNSALAARSVASQVMITKCHHIQSKGSATYYKTGNKGDPSSGDEAVFFDGDGNEWVMHGDSIDYYQFGSDLDGISDDTISIIKAHTFANKNKVSMHQIGGVAKVSPNDSDKQIIYNTDVKYMGGFKFLVENVSGRGFVVRSIEDETTINQADVVIGEFLETRMKIPSLSAFHNNFAVIQSSEVDLNRKRDSGQALQLKKQPVIIGDGGSLDAPLWCSFGSISSIKLQSVLIPTITISGFHLETTGASDRINPFGIQRNNVVITDTKYTSGDSSLTIPVQSLISVEFSYNVKISGASSDSLSKGIIDYNYVINTWCSSLINISNITSFDGWAQVDGNYCRNVTIKDSNIDRVGSHFRCYDYTFSNLSSRRGRCIAVSGGGLLHVENIRISSDSSVSADEQFTAVTIRGDYGSEWDGAIVVKGVVFDFSNYYSNATNVSASIVSAFIDSTVGAHDFMRTVTMPKSITIRDCSFIINTMPNPSLRALGVGCTSAILSNVIYPKSITVDNITCDNRSNPTKVRLRGVEWNTLSRSEIRRKDVYINVTNVNNSDPASYSGTITDDESSTNVFLTTGDNSRISATITNCIWQSLKTSGRYIEVNVNGGSIFYFNGVDMTGSAYNFKDVKFNGTRFRGTIKVTIQSSLFENYVDTTGASIPIGNGQDLDSNVMFIIGTGTKFGATIEGSVITPSNAKSGYAQSGRYQ